MKPFCAFTIVRNEPFFLPLWCAYYGAAFGDDNLYVLDNDSTDDSIAREKLRRPRLNVKRVSSNTAFDWRWTTQVIKAFQRSALTAHEVVVYADVDEFLIPAPTHNGLRSFCKELQQSGMPYARARGWGVIHQIDSEPALALDCRYPLADRNAAWRAPQYDKTLVSTVPLDWAKGLHTVYDAQGTKLQADPVRSDLDLVHLRDVDLGVLYRRTLDRRAMPAMNGNPYLTHGSTDIRHLEAWFRTRVAPWNTGSSEFVGDQREVPEHWKAVLAFS
jgi:glycosyl transferase family 2